MIEKFDIALGYDENMLELVSGSEVTDEIGVASNETYEIITSTPGIIELSAELSTNALFTKELVATFPFQNQG